MKKLNPEPLVKSFSTGNISFQYLHYPADAPDLVLLHATGFLPWLWHPIARSLQGKFNIIAPYFCDYRKPDTAHGGISWKLFADDLYELCSALKLNTPFVAGHSMGATVITICAGLHKVNPEAVILIEPIYLPETQYNLHITVEQHPLASKSVKRRNIWASPEEAKSYLKSKALFSRWDDEMLDLYIEYGMIPDDSGGLRLKCSPAGEASIFMGGNMFSPWELLSGIDCPVLLVEGELSENRAFINLKDISKKYPDGNYMEVKGAGHLIPMEQPGSVSEIITDFFRKE